MVFWHDLRHAFPAAARCTRGRGVLLSPADLGAAVGDLESRRRAHRADLAERLRDARISGSPGDHEDHLAVLEGAAFAEMQIAQLERLVASATVVEAAIADDGVVGLGSLVRVRDESGRESEYEIVGRRSGGAERT
jgi:transcription elongation GreA/GreB family factor